MAQHDTQVNLMNYLRIFFRRKWLIFIPLIVGLGISFFVANALPKVYESYTMILIEEEKLQNPIISDLAISRSARQRIKNLREQILGWTRLVKLAEKMNLTKNIKNQKQFEDFIINDLRKNIHVTMKGSSLVRISFQGHDAEKTQRIVKTISDIFIEENIASQTKESEIAITFLEEQLKIYHRKIQESEIAELDEQLTALLVDSTDAHPMVRDLRQRITKAEERLLKDHYGEIMTTKFIKDPVYKKLKDDLQKELKSLSGMPALMGQPGQKNTQVTPSDLYKVALMTNISNVLARDLSVNQRIYNMLLDRLETARISERLEATKEGTRYIILDPPRLPLAPIKPNKVLVMVMGAFMGAALGLGLIVLMEVIDVSFLGVDEAKAVLDLPILGAISKITTDEDISREKARRLLRIGISLSCSLVFVCAIVIYTLVHKP